MEIKQKYKILVYLMVSVSVKFSNSMIFTPGYLYFTDINIDI